VSDFFFLKLLNFCEIEAFSYSFFDTTMVFIVSLLDVQHIKELVWTVEISRQARFCCVLGKGT